jgi:hypothetical protein
MMEGFPVDMTEDDVSLIHVSAPWTFKYNVLTLGDVLDRRRASERVPCQWLGGNSSDPRSTNE